MSALFLEFDLRYPLPEFVIFTLVFLNSSFPNPSVKHFVMSYDLRAQGTNQIFVQVQVTSSTVEGEISISL